MEIGERRESDRVRNRNRREERERMRENDTEDSINLRGERGKREILTEQ